MSILDRLPGDRLLVDASLWSARLAALGEDVARTARYVDLFHLDVSDAHFVPGLLFFPDLVAALRPLTSVPFHAHLMVARPAELVEPFAEAGADLVTVHVETGPGAAEALSAIRRAGRAAGLAVALETELDAVVPLLDQVELIVMMGTRLGVKGQDLAPNAPERIGAMRQLLREHGCEGRIKIAADGGIRAHTVPALRAAGANAIVPGSLLFGSADLAETTVWLHSLGPASHGEL